MNEADKEHQEHELGDLLLVLTSLARHLDLNAESALRKASARFNSRFRYIETHLSHAKEDIHTTPVERLEELWQAAKKTLG